MGRGLIITKDGEEWTFTDAEAEQISNCSEFIQSLIEQELEINEDSEDDITIPIDSADFSKEEVAKAIEYLKHHNFKPPLYGKVSIIPFCSNNSHFFVIFGDFFGKIWSKFTSIN